MSDASQITAAKFKVQGMDCAACVSKIEKAVSRLDGVTEVKVGLQTETLTASLSSPEKQAAVEEAVRKLGYSISRKD